MQHVTGVLPLLPQGHLPSYQDVQLLAQAQAQAQAAAQAIQQAAQTSSSGGQTDGQSSSSPSSQSVATVQLQEAEQALENDKRAIYRHPLFPLLALLFEKCEQATQTPDCPTADSFNVDIQAFVQQQEQERKPFFSDDSELDNLMVKAIQVLRIHLLELEKVNELCKDFCNRYISCLKGKLQSENILRTEGMSGFDSGELSPTESESGQSLSNIGQSQGQSSSSGGMPSVGSNNILVQQPPGQSATVTLQPGQIVSGGTVYQMVHTPQGLVAQPIQLQSPQVQTPTSIPTQHIIHGSTPLSQIGVPSTPTSHNEAVVLKSPTVSLTSPLTSPVSPTSPDEDDSKKKNKRGVLPKQATQIMKSWLFQHIVHPYPTEDEKRQIAGQTNLSLLQVNNWFINARRRILQPMLDASNPDQAKSKKTKPQSSRPVQRFWPESIANLQPQPQQVQAIQAQTSTPSSTSQTQQIVIPSALFTADGHIIASAVNLEAIQASALQSANLSPLLSQVQTSTASPTIMIQNGEDSGANNDNDNELPSSELGLENSDSSNLVD